VHFRSDKKWGSELYKEILANVKKSEDEEMQLKMKYGYEDYRSELLKKFDQFIQKSVKG
jgi:hypothetical protein